MIWIRRKCCIRFRWKWNCNELQWNWIWFIRIRRKCCIHFRWKSESADSYWMLLEQSSVMLAYNTIHCWFKYRNCNEYGANAVFESNENWIWTGFNSESVMNRKESESETLWICNESNWNCNESEKSESGSMEIRRKCCIQIRWKIWICNESNVSRACSSVMLAYDSNYCWFKYRNRD